MGARLLPLVQRAKRSLRAGGERAAVGGPGRFLGECLSLPRLELQGLELLDLVAQELELRVAITRLALEGERAIEQLEPHAMRDADLAHRAGQGAVAIEQLALRGAARQRLEFVLAMDVDEDAARLAQQ